MHAITKLFGFSKEQEPALTPQKAIQKLQSIEAMLIKKSEYLESKITGELKIAKEQKCSNKRGNFYTCVCVYRNIFLCFYVS